MLLGSPPELLICTGYGESVGGSVKAGTENG